MNEEIVIPIAGIMLPLVLVPTIITLKNRHKKREWLHQERMRALDLGLPAHEIEPRLGAGTVTAIGAGVPVVSIGSALIATSWLPFEHHEFMATMAIVWAFAAWISAGALITSLLLGRMILKARPPASADALATKPAFDPDAYDVVSMRG